MQILRKDIKNYNEIIKKLKNYHDSFFVGV